jgi:hypothetical protein
MKHTCLSVAKTKFQQTDEAREPAQEASSSSAGGQKALAGAVAGVKRTWKEYGATFAGGVHWAATHLGTRFVFEFDDFLNNCQTLGRVLY